MEQQFKIGEGKLQYSLLDFESIDELVRVMMVGSKKHGAFSYKKFDKHLFVDALMRHCTSYLKGEEMDQEDNLSHMAHAMANCMIIMYHDRVKKNGKSITIREIFNEANREVLDSQGHT